MGRYTRDGCHMGHCIMLLVTGESWLYDCP